MRKTTSGKTTRRNGESGQAIVEFAIIAPLLLAMLLGMMEWGFLLWTKMTYVNAVRDGARSAAVMRNWGTSGVANTAEVKAIVEHHLSALPVSITTGVDSRIRVELLPAPGNISSIKVTIDAQPYAPVIGFSAALVPATLSASTEFRYEDGL